MKSDRGKPTAAQRGHQSAKPGFLARHAQLIRLASFAAALLGLLVLGRVVLTDRAMAAVQTWIEELGLWGIAATFVLYVVGALLLFPASVLTLVAAAIYGFWLGTVIVSLAATTVAALAFLIARYLARERVRATIENSPKLQALDQAIGEQGWKVVALLRLSPVVPFTLQNYLYGVTAIRFWPCVLVSWAAMLPGTLMYVYLGSLGGRALAGRKTSWTEWSLRGLGLLATVAITWYLARLARQAIQQHTAIEEAPDATTSDQPVGGTLQDEAKHRPPAVQSGAWQTVLTVVASAAILGVALWAYAQRASVETYVNQWLGV